MSPGAPLRRSSGARARMRPGLTLIEAVVSTAIISIVLVGAMGIVGQVSTGRMILDERARGSMLAHELLAEAQAAMYESPDLAPGSFGRAADEPGDGPRHEYDDVDDYHGWSASPPEHPGGTPMADLKGWTRAVEVAWITPAGETSDSDTRLKRITVTVHRQKRTVGRATAIRAGSWDEIGPGRGSEGSGSEPIDLAGDLPIAPAPGPGSSSSTGGAVP